MFVRLLDAVSLAYCLCGPWFEPGSACPTSAEVLKFDKISGCRRSPRKFFYKRLLKTVNKELWFKQIYVESFRIGVMATVRLFFFSFLFYCTYALHTQLKQRHFSSNPESAEGINNTLCSIFKHWNKRRRKTPLLN